MADIVGIDLRRQQAPAAHPPPGWHFTNGAVQAQIDALHRRLLALCTVAAAQGAQLLHRSDTPAN
ncbi:hypothetical protein GCM10027262_24830 [Nocardia tengchongensis]